MFSAIMLIIIAFLGANGVPSAYAIEPLPYSSNPASCGWYATLPYGEYSLHNDVWGAQRGRAAETDFLQCMSLPYGKDGIAAEFSWKFGLPSVGIKSYPHVTYGWDFQGATSTTHMPVRADQYKQLKAYYSYQVESQSRYNVSFDIWMSPSPTPMRHDLTKEIMIWVEHQGMKQNRKKMDTVKIGRVTYDVHVGPVSPALGKWLYIAFIVQPEQVTRWDSLTNYLRTLLGQDQEVRTNIKQEWVDLGAFLKYMRQRKLISDNEYVNGISFGAEIPEGKGRLKINKFKVIKNS